MVKLKPFSRFRYFLSATAFSILFLLLLTVACSQEAESIESKYDTLCGSCHLTPDPTVISRPVWEQQVLPEMAARLGLRPRHWSMGGQQSIEESIQVKLSGTYPDAPQIDTGSWQEICDYILGLAPSTIENEPLRIGRNIKLTQFAASLHSLNKKGNEDMTNIKFDTATQHIHLNNRIGNLQDQKYFTSATQNFDSPIVASSQIGKNYYLTEIGILNPSQIPLGAIHKVSTSGQEILCENLHRPVFTKIIDLDENGEAELIVCEFGHHTGRLSLLQKEASGYKKKTLLALPGSIKVEVVDMNADDILDIVALFSQGREGIYIFYQKEGLAFNIDHCIQFPPEHGSSWFELVDYNGDGFLDIVMANGDNADYSVFLKSYHGVSIFLNDGKNNFEEVWTYPINGATRLEVEDFDQDGDLDIAVLAFFPDQKNTPEESFVYLENIDPDNYAFRSHTTAAASKANWLLMDKGDIDRDGDIDLILGQHGMFDFESGDTEQKPDLLYLENTLIK